MVDHSTNYPGIWIYRLNRYANFAVNDCILSTYILHITVIVYVWFTLTLCNKISNRSTFSWRHQRIALCRNFTTILALSDSKLESCLSRSSTKTLKKSFINCRYEIGIVRLVVGESGTRSFNIKGYVGTP